MAQIMNPKIKVVHVVKFTEFERGWGQRPWDKEYYDTEQEARERAAQYNKEHNSESTVPDWYVLAEYGGTSEVMSG